MKHWSKLPKNSLLPLIMAHRVAAWTLSKNISSSSLFSPPKVPTPLSWYLPFRMTVLASELDKEELSHIIFEVVLLGQVHVTAKIFPVFPSFLSTSSPIHLFFLKLFLDRNDLPSSRLIVHQWSPSNSLFFFFALYFMVICVQVFKKTVSSLIELEML